MRVMLFGLALSAVVACESEPSSSGGGGSGVSGNRQALEGPALWGTSVTPLSKGGVAVADPDADVVWVVRDGQTPVKVQLPAGSQPSRVVEAGGELAMVLRGSGQLARLAVPSHSMSVGAEALTSVCGEPRGVAYDASAGAVLVACAGGELVTFTGGERSMIDTGLELRDVLVAGGSRWVTTFRTAELVQLDADGRPAGRLLPPKLWLALASFTPRVAWRAVVDGQRVVMVHQLHVNEEVTQLTNPGPGAPYYGKPYCTASVVSSALTAFDVGEKKVLWSKPIVGSLPVDVAVGGGRIAVAFAGAGQVLEFLDSPEPLLGPGGCLYPTSVSPGAPTGVGYTPEGLEWFDRVGKVRTVESSGEVALVTPPRAPIAPRTMFHQESPSGVACASCHPEGFDDGHTWRFGPRTVRSQSLEGGLSQTAPFHWDGRFRTLTDVLDETLVARMGGVRPDTSATHALGDWLDRVPARAAPPLVDLRSAKLGALVFSNAQCGACHSGPELTNGTTVDVGTGGKFQVPSLKALRWRGPWMHDGCAQVLGDRFDPSCGGASHGNSVAPADVPDLVEYLKTL